MKRIIYTIFCLSFFQFMVGAQGIMLNESGDIAAMMQTFVNSNRSISNVDGWRIQLMATTDRGKMENARQKFINRYPNITVDWVHQTPYYKLRAGAFPNRMEAMRMIYLLKPDYPGAYPAKDNRIRPEELAGFN